MAVVTPINRNSVAPDPVSPARFQPADFGAGGQIIGRAVAGLGETGMQAAETENLREIEYARTQARDADNKATAQRQALYYEGDNAFFNLQGRNALNAAPELQRQREEIDRNASASLSNPVAQHMFSELASQRSASDNIRISEHLNTESNRYEDTVDDDALHVATAAAINANANPPEILRQLDTSDGIIARNAARHGIGEPGSPEVVSRQRRAAATIVGAVADAMRRRPRGQGGGPGEAQAFIVSMANRIDPQEATRLLSALDPEAAQESSYQGVQPYLVYTGDDTARNADAPATGPAPPAAAAVTDPADPLPGFRPGRQTLDTTRPAQPGTTSAPTAHPPGNVHPTPVPPNAAMYAAIAGQESGGSDRRPDGTLITSPRGAQGMMQVMPDTERNPGYGIRPGNGTDADRNRVGREVYDALLRHYSGNVTLALTAYNWGQRHVDEHIRTAGDPRTGAISDSAWLASIPVVEARDYATSVLRRVGVNPATSANSPANQQPTFRGSEINLDATVNRIMADRELSYPQQQALIQAAQTQHSLGAQARAESENRLRDQAYTSMIALGPNFTNYNQLPLTLRQQLSTMPELVMQLTGAARTNLDRLQHPVEQQAWTSRHALDLLELANGDANQRAAFMRQDLRTDPGLTSTERENLINRQGGFRRENERTDGQLQHVDTGQIRRLVNVVAGTSLGNTSTVTGLHRPGDRSQPSPDQTSNAVMLEERVRLRAEAERVRRGANGQPLSDADVMTIINGEMQPVTVHLSTGDVAARAYQSPGIARANPTTYRGTQMDLPPGVPASDGALIVEAYRTTHGGGYPSPEEILRLYQARYH